MFKKMAVAVALVLIVLTAGTIQKAQSQDTAAAKSAPEVAESETSYRLDFSLNEMEDGKKINTRQYSVNIKPDNSSEVKIGTRVPVEAKQGEFQYVDVGTSIWARLENRNGQINLSARAEMSNFAIPPQQDQLNDAHHSLIRQLKIDGSTVALLGKPMLLASVDDPNSKRTFQLEVTVTKLR